MLTTEQIEQLWRWIWPDNWHINTPALTLSNLGKYAVPMLDFVELKWHKDTKECYATVRLINKVGKGNAATMPLALAGAILKVI